MAERLGAFLSVKSVVTIVLTVIFGYLSAGGRVSGQEFLNVYSIVIAFYFGTQARKTTTT